MQLLMDVIVNVLKNNLKMKMKLLKVIVIAKFKKMKIIKENYYTSFFPKNNKSNKIIT
jgi:hypothetical protein